MKTETIIVVFMLIFSMTWQQQLTLENEGEQTEPIVNENQTPLIPTTQMGIPSEGPRKYALISTGNAFLLPIKIGGLNYNLQIDSGSSDIFIKGEQTPGKPASKYSCSACIKSNQNYNLSYLDGGAAQNYEIQLPVEFEGFSFNESILVAYQTTLLDDDQGIVGLSYAAAANNPNPTFLQTLINHNIISSYSYGVNLNLKSQTSSHITLGSYDLTSIAESLVYLALSSQQDCLASINGVKIGSGNILSVSVGLFDTGNTDISFPRAHQNNLLAAFKGQNNECFFYQGTSKFTTFYCKVTQFDELPSLTLSAQGHTFDLDKQAYLEKCQRNPKDEIQSTIQSEGTWYCSTFIDVCDEKDLIIGDAFFSRYYAYFDLQNHRIGLAKNNQNLSMSNVLTSQQYDDVVWSKLLQSNHN